MISIYVGLPGSGKTANCVRELVLNESHKITYSNIITPKIQSNITIKPEMIIKKDIIKTKKNGENVYKYSVNKEFWVNVVKEHKSVNVVIDEAHTLIDSRRSSSNKNKTVMDWLAVIRKMIGGTSSGYGSITFITQLDRRLDVITRDMATNIKTHLMMYEKLCNKCGAIWQETNETPKPLNRCFRCGDYDIKKINHVVEVHEFDHIDKYIRWKYFGKKHDERGNRIYWDRYLISDIEDYFSYYDTFQIEDLLATD